MPLSIAGNDVCCSKEQKHSDTKLVLVQSQYPGAQKWFNYIAQKYPQAHLEKTAFCVSNTYHSGPGVIYFPQGRLEFMDQVFGAMTETQIKQLAKTAPDHQDLQQFAQDEYLVLHEAAHVLHQDNQTGEIVFYATLATTALFNSTLLIATITQCCQQTELLSGAQTVAKNSLLALAGNTAIAACLYSYIRFQERRADRFANQHADQAALIAGTQWFEQINSLIHQNKTSDSDLAQTIQEIQQDPAHPAARDRGFDSLCALIYRFGLFKQSCN